MHPSAGAVAVGARPFLIAYNINLDSEDLELAKRINRGGLAPCRIFGATRCDSDVGAKERIQDVEQRRYGERGTDQERRHRTHHGDDGHGRFSPRRASASTA